MVKHCPLQFPLFLKMRVLVFSILCYFLKITPPSTSDTDLLKMVPVEILLNFGNYFSTFQLGFLKFLSGIWKYAI